MSQINVNTVANATGAGPATLTGQSAAKAWAIAGDAANIGDSFNVTSGADNGTGDYTYAVTNAFATSNFGLNITNTWSVTAFAHNGSQTTTTCSPKIRNASGTLTDSGNSFAAHGDLA